MSHRLRLAIGLTVLTSATACTLGAASGALAEPTEAAGKIKYRLDAATYFDPLDHEQAWLDAHVSMISAYPPAGDVYLPYGLPVIGYHDAATEGFSPLTASSIESYVSKVKSDASAGYAGTFLDDINWGLSYRDGSQSTSLEPEMQELSKLIEATRAAIPTGIIEMNSQYHDIYPLYKEGNPYVLKALSEINLLCKEFGVGPSSGIDTASDYADFLNFADELKAKGVHITLSGDRNSPTASTMEYNEATYLLINDGHDYLNGYQQTPGNWWPGFDVNLGEATDSRYPWDNVLRRDFTGGLALVNPPGSPTQTVSLPSPMRDVDGTTVTSVTLPAASGAVLTGNARALAQGSGEASSLVSTETTLQTKVLAPAPTTRHDHGRRAQGQSRRPTGHAPGSDRATHASPHRHERRAHASPRAHTARVRAARTGRGARQDNERTGRHHRHRSAPAPRQTALTEISGSVLHATRGTVAIRIDVRRHRRWVPGMSVSLSVNAAGHFADIVRLRSQKTYRVVATFEGTPNYGPSTSGYRLLVAGAR